MVYAFPKKIKQERMSISIPADLAQWVRDTAQKNDTTISAVVAYAIRQMSLEARNKEISRALMEDYEEELKAEGK